MGLRLGCAALLFATSAQADPQWSGGWVTGVAAEGERGAMFSEASWFNALRGELVLGRSRNQSFGIGPYAELGTAGFEDVRMGGGAVAVIPWHPYFPLSVSLGGYARRDDDRFTGGISAFGMLGSRSYNFHSNYAIAAGLVFGVQRDLDDNRRSALVVGVQLDALLLAMPVIIGVSALQSGSE